MSDDVETPASESETAAVDADASMATEDGIDDREPATDGVHADTDEAGRAAAAADQAPQGDGDARTEPPRRGWITLHAIAFALVLVSGSLVVVASLRKLDDSGLSLLRASWWVSGVAIAIAVASVLVPRRRS
jgi:hypothetical protein